MSLNKKLMKMYKEETGQDATYQIGGITRHFLGYVDWLEARDSKSSKVANDSESHNTGSPKLLIDIDIVDRAVCVKRGWGFDTNELDLMKILFPIIDQQLRASA